MTAKAVKRYTAAMMIICISWSFVGYAFALRYLKASAWGCLVGAVIAVVIVVQIERQIILSIHPGIGLVVFRGLLATIMAILGAVIIDQIILKQDIELEKITYIQARVDTVLASRAKELKIQMLSLDSTIQAKEKERKVLIEDISKHPLIKNVTTKSQSIPITIIHKDSKGKDSSAIEMKTSTNIVVGNVANPKQAFIGFLDSTINKLRKQNAAKEEKLLNIRPELENEIKNKIGFLDELEVMLNLITKSFFALGFWLLWLIFFFSIEMLVLVSKLGHKTNDYDKTVLHQMNLQERKLDVLAKMAEGNGH